MSSPPRSLEQFQALYAAEMDRQLARQRNERYRDVSPRARVWLALAPCWTASLASALDLFDGGIPADEALERMCRIGVLSPSTSTSDADDEATVYALSSNERASVLDELLGKTDGPNQLRQQIAELGGRVIAATEKDQTDVPPSTLRWATLAEHAESSSELVAEFDARVVEAFESRSEFRVLNWMEAARPLAALLARDADPVLELGLERASRRLELLHRRAYDEQQLKVFLERADQVQAFNELMHGGDDVPWVLHFMGDSGVGKTMLLRHISVNLAPRVEAASARIDFDYLNADYPRLAPGLLLWSLGQELRAYDNTPTGSVNARLNDADALLSHLHQRLRTDLRRSVPGAGEARATDDPQFRTALGLYIQAFAELNRPIVLLLDTCEELAKATPAGSMAPNVEETFRILRGLRFGPDALDDEDLATDRPQSSGAGGLARLRVVFSGRRPLASSAFEWSAPGASYLPARPYLRVHEISGFTTQEAQVFLSRIARTPGELVDPILKSTARHADLRDGAPLRNPYVLRMYAEWAADKNPPTPQDILESSPDRYVDLRIIRRLGDGPLQHILPYVAFLGHVDLPLIRVMSGLDDGSATQLFEELRSQEWVEHRKVSVIGEESRVVLDVKRNIREQLTVYYRNRGTDLEEIGHRAADHLVSATLESDMSALDWTTIDATVRALETDPDAGRGHRWWNDLEHAMLRQRDFKWVLDVTGTLLSEGAAAGSPETGGGAPSRLRPAIAATYASALVHAAPDRRVELGEVWAEISRSAPTYAVPEARDALRIRALAGELVARASGGEPLLIEHVKPLWDEIERLESTPETPLAAALVAAAEAVVEYAEHLATSDRRTAQMLLQAGPQLLAARLAGADLVLRAFALSLAARGLVICGDLARADTSFKQALESAVGATTTVFGDWVPPQDLLARIRLEFLRAVYPAWASARAALDELGITDPPPPTSVDADRLASAMLRLGLAEGPLGCNILRPLGWLESDTHALLFRLNGVAPGPATCNAHRGVPPLFATAAELVAGNGQIDSALRQLRHVIAQVEQFDLETVRDADRALVRIMRRLRLRDVGEAGGFALLGSLDLADRELVLALDGLDAEKFPDNRHYPMPELSDDAARAWLHIQWRTRFATPERRAHAAVRWLDERVSPLVGGEATTQVDFVEASLRLDLVEGQLLKLGRTGRLSRDAAQVVDPAAWWSAHRDQPEQALRLWLRTLVLVDGAPPMPDNNSVLLRQIGLRAAALIALDEGELLALRLPTQAATLVGHATRLLRLTRDDVGTLLAGTELALMRGRPIPDARKLGSALETVRAAYYRLTAAQTSEDRLPAWLELKGLARRPSRWQLSSQHPYAWRACLTRLMVCLGRDYALNHPTERRDIDAASYSAIVGAFGTTIGRSVALPAAFVGWFPDNPMRAQPAVRRSSLRTAIGIAINAGLIIVGVVGLIGLLSAIAGGLQRGLGVVAPRLTEMEHSEFVPPLAFLVIAPTLSVAAWLLGQPAWAFVCQRRGRRARRRVAFTWTRRLIFVLATSSVAFLVLLAVAVSVPALVEDPLITYVLTAMIFWAAIALEILPFLLMFDLFRFGQAWWTARISLLVRVSARDAPELEQAVPSASGPVDLRVERVQPFPDFRAWPPVRRRPVFRAGTARGLPRPDVSYARLADALPVSIVRELQQVDRALGPHWLPVRIEVDEQCHGPCWEAAIMDFGRAPQASREPALQAYRTAVRRNDPGAPRRVDQRPIKVVVWTESAIAAEIAQRAWSTSFQTVVSGTSQIGWINRATQPVRVLHLVGSAQETSAGFRFKLAQDLIVQTATSVVNRNTLTGGTLLEEAPTTSTLVRPSDVPRTFPDLGVCVLQGEPDKLSTTRLDADRRAAALARFFAARLFRQGVPAVIVIPPLPAGLAQSVAAQIAATLEVEPVWDVRALLVAASKARARILHSSYSPSDAERIREQALDVCVYVAGEDNTRPNRRESPEPLSTVRM